MQTAHVISQYQTDRPTVVVHDTEAPTFEGRLAIVLVEKWGMICAAPDGEDAGGRAKLRPLTPSEVIDRACETAERLAKELRSRGWFTVLPSWEEAGRLATKAKNGLFEDEEAARIERAANRAARSATRRGAVAGLPR